MCNHEQFYLLHKEKSYHPVGVCLVCGLSFEITRSVVKEKFRSWRVECYGRRNTKNA